MAGLAHNLLIQDHSQQSQGSVPWHTSARQANVTAGGNGSGCTLKIISLKSHNNNENERIIVTHHHHSLSLHSTPSHQTSTQNHFNLNDKTFHLQWFYLKNRNCISYHLQSAQHSQNTMFTNIISNKIAILKITHAFNFQFSSRTASSTSSCDYVSFLR